ncbi:MAG: DUF1592 domain-containing protein [Planctomycetota bacterium]|jgi:hypothetical protein
MNLFRCFALLLIVQSPITTSANSHEQQIRPFLTRYCVSCHGPQVQKAKLRLDRLDPDLVNGSDADMWQEVLDLINISEMPPGDAPDQPAPGERQAVVEALTASIREAMETRRSTGGRNVLRRLTAYEYSNTLRDLLHLDLQYAADLPPEGAAAGGFKNNTSVLGTSALHIEYFERIARVALEKIILTPEQQPVPYFVRIEPELAFTATSSADASGRRKGSKRKAKPVTGVGFSLKAGDNYSPGNGARAGLFRLEHGEPAGDSILLAGNRPSDKVGDVFARDRKIGGAQGDGRSGWQPEFRVEMYEVPHEAPVLVQIRCSAVPGAGGSLPRLSFELGSFRGAGVSDQKEAANVEIRSTEPKVYKFVVQGTNFPFQSNKPGRPSYFRIFNDFRRGTSQLTYDELPKLKIDWVEITGNHYESWPSPQRQAILFDSENRADEDAYVREVLERFMPRAYRRPVSADEVDRKVALFQRLRVREDSFEATIISTLTSILCSSHFLLISEPAESVIAGNASVEQRRLNDFELASRLSFFLWSSMPDDTLFELAARDRLHEPDVLLTQTRRMLADPKSLGFSRNFASQWLDLAGIRRLAVNPEYFDFEEKTKDLFEEESIRFVHHVLSENLSITNFIDSDFAVLNPVLARHYRIPGVSGGFQIYPVSAEHHRGGLMTQASMLFGNSTGAETHPIRRGVWVLERMLDDPPPPPPPSVPDLPEPEVKDEASLSLKERLVAHAQVESCRDCHSKIDPWGVAFENYNALGQWREGTSDPLVKAPHQKVNVSSSTRLKNGRAIQNLDDLKRYILTQKNAQFRRAVVRKVMAYSLGRYLEFTDRSAVDSICAAVEENNDSFQTVIEQIVLSEPFLVK